MAALLQGPSVWALLPAEASQDPTATTPSLRACPFPAPLGPCERQSLSFQAKIRALVLLMPSLASQKPSCQRHF